MARIRSIKPEFWVSEQIAECSPNARLTFVGMWNFCDDRGVHPAKPKTLKAELYPLDNFTAAQVAEWVAELIAVGLVHEFEAVEDGSCYWHVTGWERHQKIDRPSNKHPAPPSTHSTGSRRTDSASTRRTDEHSASTRRAPPPGVERIGVEGNGEDGKGRERSSPAARRTPKKPLPDNFTISESVKTWAADKGYADLERHLEAFRGKAIANDYRYADWDQAFMGAIREDWARVREAGKGAGVNKAARNTEAMKLLRIDYQEGLQP